MGILRVRDLELSELFEFVGKGVVKIVPPIALSFDTTGDKQIRVRGTSGLSFKKCAISRSINGGYFANNYFYK